LQGRRGASIRQTYRDLFKLFSKEVRIAHTASTLFRAAPYIVFTATLLAAATVPLISTAIATTAVADVIAIAGMLALARFFLALAAMDVGTAFGGMGASREMFIGALAEPAMLLALFTLAMSAHSTNLSSMIEYQLHHASILRPSYLFAMVGLLMVAVAECGRIPIDNPSTHLELTMVHEAMILEYTGRHLALMEWASYLKIMLYASLLANVFLPWGIASNYSPNSMLLAFIALFAKLSLLSFALVLSEVVLAKMRLFRAPAYLNLALLLSLLGLLSHVILEVGS
jgi:formate hydrogenlyase subunit 4